MPDTPIEPPSGASLQYTITSLRNELRDLAPQAIEAIERTVAADPSLECAQQTALRNSPRLTPLSHEHAQATTALISKSLPPETHRYVSLLTRFYFGYLSSFPDPTETEPLLDLLTYLRVLPRWDALLAYDASTGRVLGGCSGQTVEVQTATAHFQVAWIEHIWTDPSLRQHRIGSTLQRAFAQHAQDVGAACLLIEIDNPFLLSSDPRGFNHSDLVGRRRFWMEEMKHAMDPFDRLYYWSKLGFGILVADSSGSVAPYEQISLDCERLASNPFLSIAVAPLDGAFTPLILKGAYTEAIVALQSTIDPDARLYPELTRTVEQLTKLPDEDLRWISLDDPRAESALRNARNYAGDRTQLDLAYCKTQLLNQDITARERVILTQTAARLASKVSANERNR